MPKPIVLLVLLMDLGEVNSGSVRVVLPRDVGGFDLAFARLSGRNTDPACENWRGPRIAYPLTLRAKLFNQRRLKVRKIHRAVVAVND